MFLKRFFTEYDDSLTHSLNIDPLGMTVIWSAFGQKIFNNRVSSISNDVRNYTLNLIHHLAIKELVESNVNIQGKLANVYPQIDSLAFKQACLIHAENIFVYSILSTDKQVDTLGILGASKGRAKLEKENEALLHFSHTSVSHLLVRQLTLGVSGRYKTPFIDMCFFDKDYRYNHPKFNETWKKASVFIDACEELKTVKNQLKDHLSKLLLSNKQNPSVNFSQISKELNDSYTNAFSSAEHIGFMSKDFWLDITELNKGAAGCLYQVIQNSDEQMTRQQLFEQALVLSPDHLVKNKLQNIIDIEPFLAECDLLFTVLMSQRNQTCEELFKSYQALGRDAKTLPSLATLLIGNLKIQKMLGSAGLHRFKSLLKLADKYIGKDEECFQHVVAILLKYHTDIMSKRGQSAWVEVDGQGHFRCNVKLSKLPSSEQRPTFTWHHRYYVDEFKQLIRGLEGQIEMKKIEADAA